jgi:hypothetical protein
LKRVNIVAIGLEGINVRSYALLLTGHIVEVFIRNVFILLQTD